MEEMDTEETQEENKPNDTINPISGTSDEPLLGSVTTFNNVDGTEVKSQQIRSSARVFKKLKLDLASSPVLEKREKKEENKQDNKKVYRPIWTSDDKTTFFEGLNEYGKDFENIQLYISGKLKKKGVPEPLIKTKDQVRHFYYRTWHKIFKYVRFADGVKKNVQELYSLINYGELRKKLGAVTDKSFLRLNELIYQGYTLLRVKGKNVRVRTPMCRALRMLNQLDERYEEIKLPNRITVELRPKNMASYFRVQSLAQNPRLRMSLPLQKRLSSVIACVNKKWKSVDARVYENALVSSNAATADCVPPATESDEKKLMFVSSLRLTPPNDVQIELPSINLSEYLTRHSICFTAYEDRMGIKSSDDIRYYSYKQNLKKSYRQRTDSASEKTIKNVEDGYVCCWNDAETDTTVNKVNDEAVNTILALQQSDSQGSEESKVDSKTKLDGKIENDNNGFSDEKLARIQDIKNGWDEENCQSLTVGEVYLMFGSNSNLIMEYSWQDTDSSEVGNKMSSLSSFLRNWNDSDTQNQSINAGNSKPTSDLSHAFAKLVSLAKLHSRHDVMSCSCGHVCGTKTTTNFKTIVGKTKKILPDKIEVMSTSENSVQFLDPTPPPTVYFHPVQAKSQLNSIQRLKPRYCNRRGRKRSKQVVVERKLPLLPNRVESGHQIVRMSIISQESQSGSTENNENAPKTPDGSEPLVVTVPALNADDSIISTAPSSPSRLLKEGDDHWINSEVADYSLSSLLGHLESPAKAVNAGIASEDSRLSQDVDAQLRSLLTETSVDFAANFADLAAVVDEVKK